MQKRFALSLLLAAAPALAQGIGALTAETKKANQRVGFDLTFKSNPTPFFCHFLARLFVEQVFRVFSVPVFSFERRLPFSCPRRLSAHAA